MHEEGARRPSTATTDDNTERVHDMILLDRRVTIDEVANHLQIIGRLKPEIRSKHQGQLSKGIVLLHDNARPHTAAHTVETLQKLNFEVLAHPPYSPDLAPSDCHLFGPLKEALRGRRFTSDQELKEAVHAWLAAQPKTFYSEGIKKFVQRWKKCIEKQGDYVEKWCYCKFYIVIEIKFVSVVRIVTDSPTYINEISHFETFQFTEHDINWKGSYLSVNDI